MCVILKYHLIDIGTENQVCGKVNLHKPWKWLYVAN